MSHASASGSEPFDQSHGATRARRGSPVAADLVVAASLWRSRHVRWLVAAAALVIATIVIAVGALLWNLRNAQIARSEKDLESLVLVLSEQIDRTFVRAVIDLGHSLDIPVLAEGVETAAQHLILLRNGCDQVQGYLTGRPQPIEAHRSLFERGQKLDLFEDAALSLRPSKRASPSRQGRR